MYQYKPLSREDKEVRLLRVSSPTVDDVSPKLVLELRHESLSDESIQYAALSYVWGHDTRQEMVEIEINGAPFLITRNLHEGLGRLLRSVGCAVVPWPWIDAICINQADNFEKSWQVSQMGTIYNQAEIVYMMISLGSAETGSAMDFISCIGPRAVISGAHDLWSLEHYEYVHRHITARHSSPSQSNDKKYRDDSDLARFIYDLLHENCLYPSSLPEKTVCACIEQIFMKEYWSRVWIIQDVALARRAMVICGERSVSLDDFDGTMMAVSIAPDMDFIYWLQNIINLPRGSSGPRIRHCPQLHAADDVLGSR